MGSLHASMSLGAVPWGYAEGEPTIVGVMVAGVAASAIVFVSLRVLGRGKGGERSRRGRDRARDRG